MASKVTDELAAQLARGILEYGKAEKKAQLDAETVSWAEAEAADAEFGGNACVSSEYSEFIQATNDYVAARDEYTSGQSLPTTAYEEEAPRVGKDASPIVSRMNKIRKDNATSNFADGLAKEVCGKNAEDSNCRSATDAYLPAVSVLVTNGISGMAHDAHVFNLIDEVPRGVLVTDALNVAEKSMKTYEPFPSILATKGPVGLLIKGGIMGAVVGGAAAGYFNLVDYMNGAVTGEDAVIDTITDASICATASAVGMFVGGAVGSVVPGAGTIVGGLVGLGIGTAVGWSLEKIRWALNSVEND